MSKVLSDEEMDMELRKIMSPLLQAKAENEKLRALVALYEDALEKVKPNMLTYINPILDQIDTFHIECQEHAYVRDALKRGQALKGEK